MKPIIIEPTQETPKITCEPGGKILVQGKSLTEDPIAFYTPVLQWLSQIDTSSLTFEMHIEYMNTASSKQVFSMLETAKANPYVKEINVDWFYESSDEDGLDAGKEFESLLDLKFKFITY